ncbi:Neurobeachin-like protein 1 [Entophlyctis sp. JEL0112]|nr:Neurobeachin-like protein 1 [Entophlyctis sp. JEL0112]
MISFSFKDFKAKYLSKQTGLIGLMGSKERSRQEPESAAPPEISHQIMAILNKVVDTFKDLAKQLSEQCSNKNESIDEYLMTLKSAVVAVKCIEILSRSEVIDFRAVEILDTFKNLLDAYTTGKQRVQDYGDPGLSHVILSMWRDIICISTIVIARILGNSERWEAFLINGKMGVVGDPNQSGTNAPFLVKSLISAIEQSVAVFNTAEKLCSTKSLNHNLDVTLSCLLCLSALAASEKSAGKYLIQSETLSTIILVSSVVPLDVEGLFGPNCLNIIFCASHLATFLSLAFHDPRTDKAIASSLVQLLIKVLGDGISRLKYADDIFTMAEVMGSYSNGSSDDLLRTDEGIAEIENNHYVRVVLGLLLCFCNLRYGSDGDICVNIDVARVGSEDDLEVVLGESQVSPRVQLVCSLLLSAKCTPRYQKAVVKFLVLLLELSSRDSKGSEKHLQLRQDLVLRALDEVNGWERLVQNMLIYDCTSTRLFLVSSAALQRNIGLVKTLLKLICPTDGSFDSSKSMVILQLLRGICENARANSLQTLLDADFLRYLMPLLIFSDKDMGTEIRAALLKFFLCLVSSSSEMALALVQNDRMESFLVNCIIQCETPEFSEVLALGNKLWINSVGMLLSSTHRKQKLSREQISAPISFYLGNFVMNVKNDIAVDTNLKLLASLRSLIKLYPSGSVERGNLRHRLIETGLAEKLIELFSVNFNLADETSQSALRRIYIRALMKTIGVVLTGSMFANRYVKSISGFDDIINRLFREGQQRICLGFLNDMIGLLAPRTAVPDCEIFGDGQSKDFPVIIERSAVVRNLSVLGPLFTMFGYCDHTLRIQMLEYIDQLVNGHEMNRVLMNQVGAVDMMLKSVLGKCDGFEQLEKFIKVFEVSFCITISTTLRFVFKSVAIYSISVAEAKYLFQSLRPSENPHNDYLVQTPPSLPSRSRSQSVTSLSTTPRTMSRRPSGNLFEGHSSNSLRLPVFYDHLLKCVLRLFQRKEPDLDMFYYSGRNSGLVLPIFEKWPASAGYTFFMWIKIENYATDLNKPKERYLWSMRTETGDGVELFIENERLVFRIHRNGQTVALTAQDIPLLSKRWYFISVTHLGPKMPWQNTTDVCIYINGTCRFSGKSPFPDTKAHIFNRIGADGYAQNDSNMIENRQSIFVHSTDSVPDIGDHAFVETVCRRSFSGQTTGVYLMDDILTPTQVAALYEIGPGHCSQFKVEDLGSFPDIGKVLFDGTLYGRILLQLYPTATKFGRTVPICFDVGPRSSGEILMRDVVACSSKCLQTAVHAFGGIEVTFPLVSHLNYSNIRFSTFLQIVALMVSSDIAHMERFAVVQGPKIISLLLQQQNIFFMNMKSLDYLMALVKVTSEVMILSPKIAAPGSILSTLADDLEETHRAKYGIGFLLDLLEKFYWLTPPDYLTPELLAKIVLSRKDETFVFKMRHAIFAVMKELIQLPGGMRPDECHRIISSLWNSSHDPLHLLDLLKFIIDASLETGSNNVIESFTVCASSAEVLVSLVLLSSHEQSSRTPKAFKSKLRFNEFPGSFGETTPQLRHYGPIIAKYVARHGLSDKFYQVLLQMTIEQQLVDWQSDETVATITELETISLTSLSYLSSFVEVLSQVRFHSPVEAETTILRALNDLDYILSISTQNSEFMRKLYGWQFSLMKLVANERKYQEIHSPLYVSGFSVKSASLVLSPVCESPQTAASTEPQISQSDHLFSQETVNRRVFQLFAKVVLDGFITDRKAWRIMEETIVFLWESKISSNVISGILETTTRKLKEDIQNKGIDLSNAYAKENVYHYLCFLEEYLFSHQDLFEEFSLIKSAVSGDTFDDDIVAKATRVISLKQKWFLEKNEGVHIAHPFLENFEIAQVSVELCACVLSLDQSFGQFSESSDKEGRTISDLHPKQIECIFAHMTEAYKFASGRNTSSDNMLSPKALLPLFDKLLTEWRDRIYELWKSHGGSVSDLENTEENTSNIDQLINSTTWSEIYESSFFPASKAVEEDELAQVSTLRRRFNRTARSAVQVFQKEVENESKMFATLDSHLNSVLNRKLAEGKYRGPELLSAQEMDRKLVARRWLALFNQLTQERGIWLPKKARNSKQYSGAHWKLDRVENRMRMHRRLMRNFEFDDHSEASIRRDKSHQDKDPQPADLSISQLSISEQKRVTAEKLRYHMKLGASNDELRQVSSSIGNLHVTESELAEEDWSVLTSDEMGFADAENFLFSCECEMIMLMTAIRGRLELTSRNLTFFADLKATASGLSESDQRTLALIAESEVLLREKRWPISKLREVYFRRYKLRNSAVEFFFLDGSNYFFNFLTTSPKMRLVSCIIRLRPENLKIADVRAPTEMIAKSGLTERWMKHEISNFEYLMHLNTISGRTHNDLTQYPVFPWVLTDYKSAEIDLSDPSIYRDLSKPIGALDPVRLEQYVQRYEAFEDPNGSIKKFMYGTHYSTAAAVLYYLLRLEPFTSLHIALQGGKFDHPDRQFDGIQSCWSSVLTGNGDVKELIPEFFYMPEFLVNENKFDLGTKQTGARLDDVHLPPWAATPEDFIRIHREALESDYVSNHLHEWIDLIWGYKQTGPESVKAHNVFYYLTYEGNINIDEIEDPVERRSIEDQINNFGQTPTQLFKKPHPKRGQSPDCLQQKIYDIKGNYQSTVLPVSDVKSGSKICFISTTCKKSWRSQKTSGLKMLGPSEREKIVLIDSELMLGTHKWNSGAHNDASVGFEPDTTSLARRQV